MKLIAIDPGSKESAFVVWDGKRIWGRDLLENNSVKSMLQTCFSSNEINAQYELVIEKVACYGMPVGESIFETVYWSGRFTEAFAGEAYRLPRKDVKMHLCGNVRAKDSNVTQALVDRFAPFEKNKGKGTKKSPGFFYRFKADIWQAFALAVTYWDLNN
jgi:hypothetical protein